MQEKAQNEAELGREAKSLMQSVKAAIKRNDALDKEVEFQRKKLRTMFLKLLLLFPYAKETKDIETHIWMQTSYQFIAYYKQRIGSLDRKLFAAPQKGGARQDHVNGGGPVEYRKLLSRFRQFLAEEERFYMQLLTRFCRQFALTEMDTFLRKLELVPADQDTELGSKIEIGPGRNLFPGESEPTPPENQNKRDGRLLICGKFLVCMGDLARYRELYNDSGGRPRAGQEDGQPARGARGAKRGGRPPIPRARDYSRASNFYEQARLLVPDDGNASNQLAILASYQKDTFACVLHYYRALCVKQPFETASDNLHTILRKALDEFRTSRDANNEETPGIQRLRSIRFKQWVVVLHGLWLFDNDETASRASRYSQKILKEFSEMIEERLLVEQIICDVVVMSISALWKVRMIRDPRIKEGDKRTSQTESLIANHVLDLARVLFDSGERELTQRREDEIDSDNIAMRITAVFRRTLPAMRIFSKWVRSNFTYIESLSTSTSTTEAMGRSIQDFWKSYAAFSTALKGTFPVRELPSLEGPLEEDVAMSGFLPIKRLMFQPSRTESGRAPGLSQVHPNEEYLMRISDFLSDVNDLVAGSNSPVTYKNGVYVYGKHSGSTDLPTSNFVAAAQSSSKRIADARQDVSRVGDSDDDGMTQASRADDDPVRDAFNEALGGAEDDDDEILWDPRAQPLSPQMAVIQPTYVPAQAFSPPRQHVPMSPLQTSPSIPASTTTAQDLLNNFLGTPFSSGDLSKPLASSTPQASLLFGSGSVNAPTNSIWTSTDSGPSTSMKNIPQQYYSPPSSKIVPPGLHSRSNSFAWPTANASSQNHNLGFDLSTASESSSLHYTNVPVQQSSLTALESPRYSHANGYGMQMGGIAPILMPDQEPYYRDRDYRNDQLEVEGGYADYQDPQDAVMLSSLLSMHAPAWGNT